MEFPKCQKMALSHTAMKKSPPSVQVNTPRRQVNALAGVALRLVATVLALLVYSLGLAANGSVANPPSASCQ